MTKEPFREELRRAARKLDREGVNLIKELEAAAEKDNDRDRCEHALTAIIRSLEGALDRAKLSRDLTQPLRRLRDALDDLDRGIVAPVVKPVKLKGTPGTPYFKQRIKAFAVLAVENGKAQGRFDTLDDGYREVASFLSRAGLSGYRGGPLKDTAVKDWRRDLIKRELENARSGIPPTRGVDLVTAAIYADEWFRKMPYDQLRNILRAMVEHYTQELKSEDLR